MYKVEQFIHHGVTFIEKAPEGHESGFYRVFEVKFYGTETVIVVVTILPERIVKVKAPTRKLATAARWVVNTWLRQNNER